MKGTALDAARRESPGWPDGAGAVIRPSAASGRTLHRPAPDFLDVAAQTAARRAEHAAVEGPDARLTYAEVDQLSNQLAHRLVALGVGRDQCVGISMPRGAAELVAMLAVSKAGGAYVPLDPSHPVDRLRLILEDAAPAAMLVHSSSPMAAAPTGAHNVIVLDDLRAATAGQPLSAPRGARGPARRAGGRGAAGAAGRPRGGE